MHDKKRPKDGKGRYIRSPETAERDAKAARLRAEGHTYDQIREELGYGSKSSAHDACARALRAIVADDADALRQREAARLDALYEEALTVLERTHYAHSHGRLVLGTDGKPLLDDGPKLAALRELRAVRESYRKLYGLDAPTKVSLDAQQLGAEISGILDTLTGDGDSDG
ncbi:hypothetical protein KVH15_33535 [Streptomyces olivaceus]|uniref:hypothetical protein n=1 Tax=Streptomyces olivaceus TaxID=47716 RepID=UPI001CCD018D|nr:hypothetical protein [Streptomyces olivaceus]MBZ6085908.1 hypothetical protein [Streptomyces olivaceus]